MYELRLFIAGNTGRSSAAVRSLEQICEQYIDDDFVIEVIDVLEQPREAEADRILATPTLLRKSPLPLRRIVGDLSDIETVLEALGLARHRTHH